MRVNPLDIERLAKTVGELLQQCHLTLAVAESCTGGLLAARITDIPGSSAYFEGGVVTYSYEAKKRILGVPVSTLETYGAVSAETAIAMARGVQHLLGVDLALAITGIAGPTGATPTKPVGLTYIALASAQGVEYREYLWTGNRWENRKQSVQAALEMVREYLEAVKRRSDE